MPAAPIGTEAHRVYHELADARRRLAARDHEIVHDQVALAEVAAPTGDEAERARLVAARFTSCGLCNVEIDGAGNVVGRRPGARDAAPIVVCAHLDTVFPRETRHVVRRQGRRLVGPSINDNARGVAAMLAIAEEIDGERVPLARPVEFVATTGEEGAGDLRGAKHYFASRGRDAAAVIAIDGAGDERIVHRALGSRRYRVAFDGPGGHSWAAFGAANAINAAAHAAHLLSELPLPATPRTALSVCRMGGGISVNSIPEHAWFDVDLRSTDASSLDAWEREIHRAVGNAVTRENERRSGGRPLGATITTIGSRPCGETPCDHEVVRLAEAATRAVGCTPELATASTDANVPIGRGVPAITIGAGGRGGDVHTASEWFENAHGARGLARALTIVVGASRL